MAAPTAEAPKGKTEEAKAAENGKASKNGNGKHEEAKPADNGKASGEEKAAAPAAGGGGGKLKAFIPLIATVLIMPGLAFAMTKFVLLPKLTKGLNQAEAAPAATPSAAPADAPADAKSDGKPATKVKKTVSINKLLVNVAGTMGTRYLMSSITLVGNTPDFEDKINDNMDQLKDLATGTLSSKTISDLEKPGARNVIRAELISVFNSALGAPLVQEIYITEMAIQ